VAPITRPSPTYTHYRLETPFVRISPNPTLGRMMERREQEERSQDILQQVLLGDQKKVFRLFFLLKE
jgi:hypothetical protein